MTLQIKPATQNYWHTWLALRTELWPHCPREKHEVEMQAILEDTQKIAFIAFLDQEGIGFAECSLRPYAEGCSSSPVGYLEGWYVRELYRKQGIGRALIDHAQQWAKTHGCTEMASDCSLGNTVSRVAHQKMGFTEYAQLVHFVMKLHERKTLS